MKKIFISVFCIFLSAFALNAQDTASQVKDSVTVKAQETVSSTTQDFMTKKDGTTIVVKIISVSDDIVEYKRANYLDGPTFSISVLDIDCITYANGDVQKFENVEAQKVVDKGITIGMPYSEYKHFYKSSDYSRQDGDRFSPVASGVSSFFISGLGQMENDQFLKGICMLVGTYGLVVAGCFVGDKMKRADGTSYIKLNGKSYACWAGALAIDVWSICDAIKVAKIKNLYARDCQKIQASTCDIKIMPDLALASAGQNLKPTAGVALVVRF